jgi:hypothetical protein
MPRGVPNSGKRSPRAPAASSEGFEETVAGSAVDDEDRVAQAASPQTWSDDPTPELIEAEAAVTAPTVTAEVAMIEQLKEQVAQQQALLAKLTGHTGPLRQADVPPQQDGGLIRIHFLEDGFTALNKVFYRGDELEFEPGSQAYADTCDRNGKSWLDYRFDEFGQVDRWGRIMFRNGPWPGKTYVAGSWETLRAEKGDSTIPPPTAEQLARAEKLRQRRSAPTLPPVDANA